MKGLIRRSKLLTIVLTVILLLGIALAASLIISNTLQFDTTLAYPVTLTKTKDLSSSVDYGVAYEIKVRAQASRDVTEAYLVIDIAAEEDGNQSALDDPSALTLEFTNPDTEVTTAIELTTNGNLTGNLISDWDLPADYNKVMTMELTFNDNAPMADYTVNLWVQSEAELPTPTPTPTPELVPDQTWRVQDIGQQGFAGMQSPCMGGHSVQWDANDYVYVVCDGNTHYSLQHPDYLNGQPFSPCVGYGGMPWNMEEHVLE